MNIPVKPGSVVVGTDGSPGGDAAVAWAAGYAEARHRPVVLVDGSERTVDHSLRLVRLLASGLDVVVRTPRSGPRQALVELSERASLVVVGTRGRSRVRSLVLGSVSAAVCAHASCPVVVVRPRCNGDASRPGPVTVGIDGTSTSDVALAFAFDLASADGLPLEVVHNWVQRDRDGDPSYVEALEEEDRYQRALHVALAGDAEKYPDVLVRRHMPRSSPVQTLGVLSEVASIVVVGARHDPGPSSLITSVSRAVVQRARCTVAVVRA